MASTGSSQSNGQSEAADFAKALQELQRGEKAATALEQKLSAMEARIDALMAQAEQEQQEVQQGSRVAVKSGQDGTTDEEKA